MVSAKKVMPHLTSFLLVLIVSLCAANAIQAQFIVTDRSPTPQSTQALASDPIVIEFSQNIDVNSVEDGIIVQSSLSGNIGMNITQVSPSRISLTPECGFTAGEQVFITVTEDLLSETGIALSSPVQWRYTVQPEFGVDEFEVSQYDLSDGSEPSAIISVDINDNKLPDLVVINSNNSEVTVLENQFHLNAGYLPLAPFETGIDPDAGKELPDEELQQLTANLPANSSITAADLNRNGFTDVVIAATLSNQLILLKNRADGQLEFDTELIDTGERPTEVKAADMNNNGYPDLVVAAAGSDRVLIHYNNGDGTFGAPESIDVGFVPLTFSIDDIDNNGAMDIAVVLSGEDRVDGLMNDANGNFTTDVLIDDLPFTPTFINTDNLFHDGNSSPFPDLALGASDEAEIYLYQNSGGVFTFEETLATPFSRPVFGSTADIDANGSLELISSHFASGNLQLNINSTNGFTAPTLLSNIAGPVGITTSDFDADGTIDMAVTNQTTGQVTVLLNEDSQDACLDGDGLAFGDVCVGEESTETFEVVNVCSFPLDVSVSVTNDAFSTDITDFKIEPGASESIPVTFAPIARGDYEGFLGLTYTRSCGVLETTQGFELTGRGIESELDVEEEEIDFGDVLVGNSLDEVLQIVNSGNTEAEIELSIEGGDGAFSVESLENFDLAASQQGEVIIRFTPDDFIDYEADLVITVLSDCGELEYRVRLTGTGVDPITELTLPELIDFGEVELNLTESEEFQMVNSGNVSTEVTLQMEDQNGVFSIPEQQTITLEPDAEETVTIQFSPDEAIEYTGELQISAVSDFDTIEYTIPVRGEGIDPLPDLVAVQITPESITGDYMLGESYRFDATFMLERDTDVTSPFDIIFLVNNDEEERVRFTESLSPGSTRTLEFDHTFSNEGQNTIQFVVDAENEIEELTTQNNSASVTINLQQGKITVSPNPFTPNKDGFNDAVDFDFSELADRSSPVVKIFSFNGRLVRTLSESSGSRLDWDGTDENGERLLPGVYLYVIELGGERVTRGSVTLAL